MAVSHAFEPDVQQLANSVAQSAQPLNPIKELLRQQQPPLATNISIKHTPTAENSKCCLWVAFPDRIFVMASLLVSTRFINILDLWEGRDGQANHSCHTQTCFMWSNIPVFLSCLH